MKTAIRSLFACWVVACLVMPATGATTVKFIGAGSSAMWEEFAVAAVNSGLAGPDSHHWTIKASSCSPVNCAEAVDSRKGPTATVDNLEGGNLWVVWNSAETEVWAYLSVDSVVGNRLFFAHPRATLLIDSTALTAGSGSNVISPALFKYGVHTTASNCPTTGTHTATCDDSSLPSSVYNALYGATITAAMTDIRPEDALFASLRVNCPPPITLGCLGYGTGEAVGNSVESAFSKSNATPVSYAITGTDPVSGDTIPPFSTYPVGVAPIVILVNRTDAKGLGFQLDGKFAITNIEHATQLHTLFSGDECNTGLFTSKVSHAIYPILREPLSGTMNTFEFTNMTNPVPGNKFSSSQETGVGDHNPLALACSTGGGTRYRAIGTGEVIGAILNGNLNSKTNTLPIADFNGEDSIGYAFFSYENVSKLATATTPSDYGYLTLDGVDPLLGLPGYVAGQLPVCSLPCAAEPGTTYTNIRNGSYRSFSFLRLVADKGTTNATNAAALVAAAQSVVNLYVPDFVPYKAVGKDPGMKYYRSHFLVPKVGLTAVSNGVPFADPSTEAGGDVGGCIEHVADGTVTGKHENVAGGCTE